MTQIEIPVSAKLTPPAAVSGTVLLGYPLQSWVLYATLIYTALNVFFLLRDKVYRPWKAKRDEQVGND
jgi:hypothetical protein